MLNAIPPAPSCATGWLAAAQHIVLTGDCYNLVVDIDQPHQHTPADVAIIVEVDRFLRSHNANPISTVGNTIFPQDLYRRFGAAALREEYLKAYDAIVKKGWGRYFERMIRWPGDGGKPTNQLGDMITRMRSQLAAKQTFRNVYELTLFDPARDRRRNRNRQCLSFLSFKLHPQRGLMLTAMYRNHHYIARALGNFIGLGHLMVFIAEATGSKVGSLTCVSTHAEIDCGGESWTKAEARHLIERLALCESSFNTSKLGIQPATIAE